MTTPSENPPAADNQQETSSSQDTSSLLKSIGETLDFWEKWAKERYGLQVYFHAGTVTALCDSVRREIDAFVLQTKEGSSETTRDAAQSEWMI